MARLSAFEARASSSSAAAADAGRLRCCEGGGRAAGGGEGGGGGGAPMGAWCGGSLPEMVVLGERGGGGGGEGGRPMVQVRHGRTGGGFGSACESRSLSLSPSYP